MDLHHLTPLMTALLLAAGVWAGAQNALAGGGSFITLPTLMLAGMDARAANITSTVALFPGQAATGWRGRSMARGAEGLSFTALALISLAGGAVGAVLLLLTPSSFFERLVPWLVLFATAVFAWGSFGRRPEAARREMSALPASVMQFGIAIYGGYFGGGIGFLMLAVLTLVSLPVRAATATKNVLAAAMNLTAVVIFLFSGQVHWLAALVLGAGAVLGGLVGAWMLRRVDERALRVAVVVIGLALTVGLFVRQFTVPAAP
ncbi:MAG: sulfite exporter TauE/SafE family protein [Caulobacterales bacterium]